MPIRTAVLVLFSASLIACGREIPEGIEGAANAEEALRIDIHRHAVAYDYAHLDDLPHGVAGDERYVFVAEPMAGRVVALDRLTGRQLAQVPAPPRGWILPFAVHLTPEGTLAVLDPGGFPQPGVITSAEIQEYAYSFHRGRLRFVHVRTISFAGLPIVFAEDFHILDDGTYVLAEQGIGALWIALDDGTVVPGLFPAAPTPDALIPALAGCVLPPGTVLDVDGVPFAVGFVPGVSAMADRDGTLYFTNTCTGGIWSIPIASLTDPTRPPWVRADDIVRVAERDPDEILEPLKGLAFRDGDPWLYAVDVLGLGVIRIDPETGEREDVIHDDVLFNFPVSAAFLPPVLGISPLVVVSDQEHRFAMLNAAIPADDFELPFLVTKVYVH